MVNLDYNSKDRVFIITLKNERVEYRAKLASIKEITFKGSHWEMPRSKEYIKKLYNVFKSLVRFTPEASKEVQTMGSEGTIVFDYDKKTNKFELHIPKTPLNHKFLINYVGECRYRSKAGCYSIPNNFWSIQEVFKHYGANNVEPTPKAMEVLDRYTVKYRVINQQLMPTLKKIKQLDVEDLQIDHNFKTEPFEHQVKMFWASKEFLKLDDIGFAYYAEPGTGKSLSAVNTIEYLLKNGHIKKCLVVTPASIKYNFAEQMEEHCNIRASILHDYAFDQRKGRESQRRWRWTDSTIPLSEYYNGNRTYLEIPNSPVVIVNYDCIAEEWENFKDYDLMVCDEMHYLSRYTSNRSDAVFKLRSHIPKFLGMTATPIRKDVLDLFSQIRIVDDDLFPNKMSTFEEMVAESFYDLEVGERKIRKIAKFKDSALDMVNEIIYTRGIRYTSDECLNIPKKTYERITVDMPADLEKLYVDLLKDKVAEFGEMGDVDYKYVDASNALSVVTYARQLSAGFINIKDSDGSDNKTTHYISDFKVKAMADLLKTFDPGQQVIIWYKHKAVLKMITKVLDKMKGKRYAVMNGDVKDPLDKQKISIDFREGKYDYIVASVDVTEGWQGQCAKYAIFLENNWTFDKRNQAEGRVHRPGQTQVQVIYDIVAANGYDNRILRGILNGESLSERILMDEIEEWAPFMRGVA